SASKTPTDLAAQSAFDPPLDCGWLLVVTPIPANEELRSQNIGVTGEPSIDKSAKRPEWHHSALATREPAFVLEPPQQLGNDRLADADCDGDVANGSADQLGVREDRKERLITARAEAPRLAFGRPVLAPLDMK